MRKLAVFSALLLLAGQAAAEDATFEQSGLSYKELAAGKNDLAMQQLEASKLSANDPAQLINLGRAYVRLGHYDKAAQAFRTAMDSNSQFDVRLADGRTMSSHDAAKLSLDAIEGRIATR